MPIMTSGCHIDAVMLIAGGSENKMKQKSKRIWSIVINTPFTRLTDHATYHLVAEISSSSIATLHLLKHQKTLHSGPYTLTGSGIERVFFNTHRIEESDFAEHYLDIMNYADYLPLTECCMQIENLSKKHFLETQKAVQIYKTLLSSIHRDCHKHWLLMLVILGNISRQPSSIAETLQKTEIDIMLQSIKYFKLSDLTTATSNCMPTLILELCKKAQGERFCFFMFVGATFPFLDEEKLSDILGDFVTRRRKLMPDITKKEEDAILQVFEYVYDRTPSDSAAKFLNQLFLHSPIALAVKAFAFMKQRKGAVCFSENSVSKMIFDSLLGSLKSFLKSAQRTSSDLLDIWDAVKSCLDLLELTKTDFEYAFIRTLNKIPHNDTTRLRNVMLEGPLFESTAQQNEIIDSVTRVRRPDLHYFLFEILSIPKFRETAEKTSLKWLSLCLENGILELKKAESPEAKLKNVYLYLSRASELSFVKDNEELQRSITTITVEFLRQFDLKRLMRAAKVFDELTESFTAGELFMSHVKALLHSQQRNDYHELLLSLCGTYGEIRVNTR